MTLVLTCEHAGNLIPEEFKTLFKDDPGVLETHRGYDPGALDLYSKLKDLASYSRYQMESRLLIELNRSLNHPALFSKFTGNLPAETKQQLIEDYYLPYRTDVENAISEMIGAGEEVLHLSIHSFTPELNGQIRHADVGLLYDPSRDIEKNFCRILRSNLKKKENSYKVRFNYPYRGVADGFTTALRKVFRENYAGIEVEVNQKFTRNNEMDPHLKSHLLSSIKASMK